MKLEYTVQEIEDLMNYIKVFFSAETVFMLNIENDELGYWDSRGHAHARHLSDVYKKMLTDTHKV